MKNKTLKTNNRAGQAFRMATQLVQKADCAFGVIYHRLRTRLGSAQATVGTAPSACYRVRLSLPEQVSAYHQVCVRYPTILQVGP